MSLWTVDSAWSLQKKARAPGEGHICTRVLESLQLPFDHPREPRSTGSSLTQQVETKQQLSPWKALKAAATSRVGCTCSLGGERKCSCGRHWYACNTSSICPKYMQCAWTQKSSSSTLPDDSVSGDSVYQAVGTKHCAIKLLLRICASEGP